MITIPAFLESFRTLKDRSMKLVFETNELTPEQAGLLQQNLQTSGVLAFNKDAFTSKMIEELSAIKCDFDDPTKSKSHRLRSVLFVYFKQNAQGYEDFDTFYNAKMEKIINNFKNKLNP